MTLPLVPSEDREYTVKQYPSNAEVKDLIRVQLRNETLTKEAKERLAEQYGLKSAEITDELGQYEADLEAARIIFKEDIPSGVGPDDISPNAVGEATEIFIGAAPSRSGGLESALKSLENALSGPRDR